MRAIVNGLLLSGFVYILIAAISAAQAGHTRLALLLVFVETVFAFAIGRQYADCEEVDPWEGR